jgi:hypothetical protein
MVKVREYSLHSNKKEEGYSTLSINKAHCILTIKREDTA